ncbi:hypothetical protein [Nonomuraea salmonea]|uniref:hypothetical protein n=1 Tax=Nonomuraea salmonea TaxID=46181 RepID=UPI0031F194C7
MSATEPRPPMSKADYVYAVLLEEIRSARIPGGTAVRAGEVAKRLGGCRSRRCARRCAGWRRTG